MSVSSGLVLPPDIDFLDPLGVFLARVACKIGCVLCV